MSPILLIYNGLLVYVIVYEDYFVMVIVSIPRKGLIYNSFGSYIHSEQLEPLLTVPMCSQSYWTVQIDQDDTVSKVQINLYIHSISFLYISVTPRLVWICHYVRFRHAFPELFE